MNFTQMLSELYDGKKAVTKVDALGHFVSWYIKVDQKTKTVNMYFKVNHEIGMHNYEFEYLDMESEWEIYQDEYKPKYKASFSKTIVYNFDYVLELLEKMDASGWFTDALYFEMAKNLAIHKNRPMAALEQLIDNDYSNCSISMYDKNFNVYRKVIEAKGYSDEYSQNLLHNHPKDFEEYLAGRLEYYKRDINMKGGK